MLKNCTTAMSFLLILLFFGIGTQNVIGQCSGIRFDNFSAKRTTFGLPDNNSDGLPDASGSLDTRNISYKNLMTGDEFELEYSGRVQDNNDWKTGFVEAIALNGQDLIIPVSASISIKDSDEGKTLTCDQLSICYSNEGSTDLKTIVNFGSESMTENGCSDFNGFIFEKKDELTIKIKYVVVGNIGPAEKRIDFKNSFFFTTESTEGGSANNNSCEPTVDFSEEKVISYAGSQDQGDEEVLNNGETLLIEENAWKAFPFNYNITANTVIQFEFKSKDRGEEHSIGFDNDLSLNDNLRFKLYGTQSNTNVIKDYDNYSGNDYKSYSIPVGQYYTGQMKYLFFLADNDDEPDEGNSYYSKIVVFEDVNGNGINDKCEVTCEVGSRCDDGNSCTINDVYDNDCNCEGTAQNGGSGSSCFTSGSCQGANATKYFCTRGRSITTDYVNVYGYHFETNLATKYDIETCEVTIKQDYLFCVGNIWAAADFWPYEYRSWGKIKEATLELPEGYDIVETDLKQYRSLYQGWFDVEYQNGISPDGVSNNKHTFDLDQYHKANGGNINVSNNTYIGYITMKISAAESQKSEEYKEAKWGFSFFQDDLIGGGVTGPHPGISYLKKILNAQMEADIQKPDLADGYPLTTSVNIKSTGEHDINDVKVYVEVPANQSIVMEPGSIEVEYPVGSGFVSVADPQLTDGMYTINLADALPATSGRNQINVRFNLEPQDIFESGDGIKIMASSHAGCEEVVTSVEEIFEFEHHFDHSLIVPNDDGYDSWGFSWGDYDSDGYPDLFVSNYEVDAPNRLYHNNGDGTFALVDIEPFKSDFASSLGSTWGDYDNDGDLDLYVSNNIGFGNFLYRNNGNGTFTKVLEDPIVNYLGYSHGVSWVDYDNDGYLDMFVADFFATKFNLLYHNNGDGTFTQNTTAAVVKEAASSTTGVWADYDGDGDQDVFITNTNYEKNSLYRNDGNGNFTKITTGAIANDLGSSTGASWGDIDNDGDLDLFVSNSGGQNNFLYSNNGDGTFTKVTSGVVANEGGHSHGSSFGDYDNDGDLDLVVANNSDELNFFYINNGDGTFESSDLEVGLTRYPRSRVQIRNTAYNSFAVGWADIDNDGDLDLYVANHGNNENCLLINQGGNYRNSSCLNFEGLSSNLAAIGTKISVKANIYGQDVWQTREITGQTGGGISAQNELEQHFGLGDADMIDSLIIDWPSGYTQVEVNLPVDDCLTIPEEAGVTVTGVAFYDENGDCKYNAGERLLSNIEVIIEPTGQTVYTNNNGEYSITLPLGKYQLSQNNSGNWIHQCNGTTEPHELALDQVNTTVENINFPSQASGNCTSVDLNVAAASTALRVGFSSLLAYTLTNNGVEDATGVEVSVDFGGIVTPTSASIPWNSNTGSIYSWSLDDIQVGESVTIYVSTEVDASATIGEEIECTINATSSEVDCNEDNNLFQERATLVGALDPNDILVDPEGPISSSDVLNYKIRFQNVGSFEADLVIVENTLPEALDLSSLEIGSVSHTYRFHIKDERTLVWEFENINLPDSTTNEQASHGFVNFRIRPKSGLENGTTIDNQAEIYFDFNEPIITNTVQNIIQDIAPGRGGVLNIFPNPVATKTSIEIVPKDLSLKQVQIKSISIYNSIGQLMIRDRNVDAYRYRMYQVDLAQGYYVVKIIGEDNNEYTGRMIIQN